MQPEVDELRPKLKEILYDAAVEIKATKAALYLADGGRYELVTEYGFRNGIRRFADADDPIVDRCGRGRTPFYVNGLAIEPRFSQLLFEASSDRLLVVPIYSRGKLIGMLDVRDKAAKAAFDEHDVEKAQAIANRMLALFAHKNTFGLNYIPLSDFQEAEEGDATIAVAPARPQPVERPPMPAPAPAMRPPQAPRQVGKLATLVIEARAAAQKIAIPPPPEMLSEADVVAAREPLRAILMIPGAVAAAFSAFGHAGGMQELASRSTMTEEALNLLQSKLNLWLAKRGEAAGYVRCSLLTPLGTSTPPVSPQEIAKVFTASVLVGSLPGLYLTVAFSETPDRATHEVLGALLAHLQLTIEQSMKRGETAALRARIAEQLLEPALTSYPELRRHSELVAELCARFARHLSLGAAEVEDARLLGLVHDVGMRVLSYDQLYRKKELTHEERNFLREHPLVGAAMVEPLLGNELARAVLAHHERVDGRGYPSGLHADEIPFLSRIVQICDAWVTMTDPESYQPAEPRESALTTIAAAAGAQFDGELAPRFVEMMSL